MGFSDVFGGMLQGFNDVITENRKTRAAEVEKQMARDQGVFSQLLQSEDPQLRAYALSGYASLNSGKYDATNGRGLQKVFGTEPIPVNPDLDRVLTAIRTGNFEDASFNAPADQVVEAPADQAVANATAAAQTQAHPGSLGMPPSPSAPGGGITRSPHATFAPAGGPPQPPPHMFRASMMPQASEGASAAGAAAGGGIVAPSGPAAMGGASFAPPRVPPPTRAEQVAVAGQMSAIRDARTATEGSPAPYVAAVGHAQAVRPRRVFPDPIRQAEQLAGAKERGETDASVEVLQRLGATDEQIRQHLLDVKLGGATSTFQSVAGELADGTPFNATFDKATGQFLDPVTRAPIPGFRPRTTTGSSSMGVDREALARAEFGKPFAALSQDQQQRVMDLELERKSDVAGATTLARANAESDAPLSTQQRFQAINTLTTDWQKVDAPAKIMRQQFAIMEEALARLPTDPVGASEAIRVTFEKILDPLSVVREAEFNRQGAGLSLIERAYGLVQSALAGGGRIPVENLAGLVNTAREFIRVSGADNDKERARIAQVAQQFGLDPALIIAGYAPTPATSGAPPPAPPTRPAPGGPPPSAQGGPVIPMAAADIPRGTPVGNAVDPSWRTGTYNGQRVVEVPGVGVMPLRTLPDGTTVWGN